MVVSIGLQVTTTRPVGITRNMAHRLSHTVPDTTADLNTRTVVIRGSKRLMDHLAGLADPAPRNHSP